MSIRVFGSERPVLILAPANTLKVLGRALLLALWMSVAQAEATRALWANAGAYSYHFDRDKDLRDGNIGIGMEVVATPKHLLMAGTFINSNHARSRYLAYQWRPLRWEFAGVSTHLGVALGGLDGYPRYRSGGWFPAALPILSLERGLLGLNIIAVPKISNRTDAALTLQFKLRLWQWN